MTKISIIAAIDENFGLGNGNKLLCHLPADLKHFKETTYGKPIIMGRNTYISIGKPLPGRQNIVLSQQVKNISGVEVTDSLEAALQLAGAVEEVMIIGGQRVFREALPFASTVYLTLIHHHFVADVFFPPLDTSQWLCLSEQHREIDEKNPYALTFYQYEKI